MIKLRGIAAIIAEVKIARKMQIKLSWIPEEIAIDMMVVSKHLIIDLEKYLYKGTDVSAKRIRLYTKVLETLGKSFRVQSVKSH